MMQDTDRLPFGPEKYREQARDAWVGNETSTDEYGERWPWKGLAYVGEAASMLEDSEHPLRDEFLTEVKRWVAAMGTDRYEGASESVRMAEIIFDVYWDEGRHPYYDYDRVGYLDAYMDELSEDAEDPEAAEAEIRRDFTVYTATGNEIADRAEIQTVKDAARILERRAAAMEQRTTP